MSGDMKRHHDRTIPSSKTVARDETHKASGGDLAALSPINAKRSTVPVGSGDLFPVADSPSKQTHTPQRPTRPDEMFGAQHATFERLEQNHGSFIRASACSKGDN